MPTIARFHGIAVFFPTRDHNPPHFHASYAGQVVRIVIATLEIQNGSLPKAHLRILLEWASHYQDQLQDRWETVRRGEVPDPIPADWNAPSVPQSYGA